jgi:hypothetical protein
MTIVTECAAEAKPVSAPETWRQFLLVRGDALRLLESVSNIAGARRAPGSNACFIQGDGPFFPEMHDGGSWAAMCAQRRPDDAPADDIYPILRAILGATLITFSDAPRAEVEAWLRERAR